MRLMKQVACAEESSDKSAVVRAAQYNIGQAYLHGVGVEEFSQGFFKLAAESGLAKAQTALGFIYSDLKSDLMDLEKAFVYHSDACRNGSVESQLMLCACTGIVGSMYLFGFGTTPNLDSAIKYLRDAARRENILAKGLLVTCYQKCGFFRQAFDLAQSDLRNKCDILRHFNYQRTKNYALSVGPLRGDIIKDMGPLYSTLLDLLNLLVSPVWLLLGQPPTIRQFTKWTKSPFGHCTPS
ncbi:LOW QUALITY PROTEIN: LRP2-binding protein-like [Octopus sinensis]|uniref:LRP2-binding protein n=1 Tax=Octopus sinensis TaxID=2607531 RepID=A0A7E6EJ35_9MOLL|nr:LOW QUALITY PROTEIN: LRP2-binding protein-like [Octopus sinensis]